MKSDGKEIIEIYTLPEDGYTIDLPPLIEQLLNPPAPAAAPQSKKSRKNLKEVLDQENVPASENNSVPYLPVVNEPLSRLNSADLKLPGVSSLLQILK